MSYDYNKVLLIGNLGDDPFYSDKGNHSVASVSLATNKSYKKGDEKVNSVQWHSLVFFGKLAELAQQYLHKGAKIFVEGELVSRHPQHEKTDQQPITQIVVQEFRLLSARAKNIEPSPALSGADLNSHRPEEVPF